ncbi:hypothetical protein CH63R_10380 [Colletotrichum higginsianum IMI 349063]|uniref:Uncharacterized protein n=1 Tax=Colletotrichum higginsianum (strain IMI 349063) TaxID=759273 RepID=A0A1B7Y2M5_COLHI|nr:uncharacterized protein CH63R_10380 [Colletotrichum higginsianum IMI 349063]OBR06260.1 hypothetical protein CH63R_10380 [Colletotrichum higginsianum IMI 349063]GJD01495.1 hypothetical protein ColKHC_10320 [Colletotrichum higginsianum]
MFMSRTVPWTSAINLTSRQEMPERDNLNPRHWLATLNGPSICWINLPGREQLKNQRSRQPTLNSRRK